MHCIFQIVRHNLGIMVPLDARLPAGSPYNLQITTPKPQTKPPNPAGKATDVLSGGWVGKFETN